MAKGGNPDLPCARCGLMPRRNGHSYCLECIRDYEAGVTPDDLYRARLRATGQLFQDHPAAVGSKTWPPPCAAS